MQIGKIIPKPIKKETVRQIFPYKNQASILCRKQRNIAALYASKIVNLFINSIFTTELIYILSNNTIYKEQSTLHRE